jgi:hypothetical protein
VERCLLGMHDLGRYCDSRTLRSRPAYDGVSRRRL